MFLFVVFFYSFLFFAGFFSGESHESSLTPLVLKQKEEIVRRNLVAQPALAAGLSFSFLTVLVAGVGLDAYLLLRGFRERPWAAVPSQKSVVRWGLKEVTQVFIFMFFLEGIIFVAQAFWSWTGSFEKISQDLFLMGNSLLRDFCVGGFVWTLVQWRGHSWNDLGLKREHFFKNIKTGLLGYVAMIPPMLVCFVLLAWIMQLFSYEPSPQNVVEIYLKKNTGPYLFLFTVFVAGLGPVLEELFFRGFIYPALKQRMGIAKAMVVTAAVFAAFHMSLAAFLPIFFLGLFLTYLYESTGSLVPSISAHVLHNVLMVTMTLGFRSLLAGS
jgi:membrane protease YdiL (CAAX protease family)